MGEPIYRHGVWATILIIVIFAALVWVWWR
jgi:hypothetical protein